MEDYFKNMTEEEFQQSLIDSDYEFYNKIRTPIFLEDIIAYPVVKSTKEEITGRIIEFMDWQPSLPGDGLAGEAREIYWRVVPKTEGTHVYVKHFYPYYEGSPHPGGAETIVVPI